MRDEHHEKLQQEEEALLNRLVRVVEDEISVKRHQDQDVVADAFEDIRDELLSMMEK